MYPSLTLPYMEPRTLGEFSLADTVKPYHRHAFACTGRRDWPPKLEESEGLLGKMARDVRALRDDAGPIPKLTATDERAGGKPFDLLVFPEAVRYRGVDATAWESILEEHLRQGELSSAAPREPLTGRWVFVCVHAASDERCGRCGPPVLEALRAACHGAGLTDVTVRATSHVGGHKYAANVLVYPEGVWYGFVTPQDVPRIVRDHLTGDRIVEEIHRGSMIGE
jgi:(2Fe-2S) ferredoxin